MRRVATLVVLGIAAWYGYQEGLPWLKAKLGAMDRGFEAVEGPAAGCLDRAGWARDRVVDEIRSLGPPPADAADWERAARGLDDAIFDAERACSCPDEACRRADEALGELRGLVSQFDALVGGSPAVSNPARRLERVDALLERARAAAAGPA